MSDWACDCGFQRNEVSNPWCGGCGRARPTGLKPDPPMDVQLSAEQLEAMAIVDAVDLYPVHHLEAT